MQDFLTIAEAAQYEGIAYNTLLQRVVRDPQAYQRTEESRESGKPRTLVAVASLSAKAQRAYRKERRAQEQAEPEASVPAAPPWYVEVDQHWYIERHQDSYHKALALCEVIREYQNYVGSDKTAFAAEYAEAHGLTQRTLYRLSKQYLEGSVWAQRQEQLTGCSCEYLKVLALCRKPKEAGQFPSLSDEAKALIENIWFDQRFRANRGTVTMLYTKLQQLALEREIACPSYQTVARYVAHLMAHGGHTAAVLAEQGVRGWKNRVMVKAERDISALPVMGIVQGDEHTFDCWVSAILANGRRCPVRPRLVAWIDMRSRVIMGDIICIDANAQILKQSLVKLIHTHGLPEYLLIDNGRDYTARELTGRDRNDRGGISFDSETQGFYRALGIKDNMRSLPYEPWSKAQIERFFGTVCSQFTRWMDSYTGTLTGSLTAGKVRKDINALHERGELLSMEAFYDLWQRWLAEEYHVSRHGGLADAGELWTAPMKLFANAEQRYERPAPPRSYIELLLMKSVRRYVRNIGIKHQRQTYMAEELEGYINRHVDIKYDPEDAEKILVYTTDGKRICEAYRQDKLPVGYRLESEAVAQHKQRQARQLRADRERLEQWTTPHELREATQSGPQVVGRLELTVKAEPQSKVIALPNDRQFAQQAKRKATDTQYIENRGRAALERIKNLG